MSPAGNSADLADRPFGVQTQFHEAVRGDLDQPRPPIVDENPPSIPIKSGECPKLESVLYQLTITPTPARFAQQHGIADEAGLVRVVIDLNQPDLELPEGYQLREERRLGRQVRARAPLASLCRLSEQGGVGYVHMPLTNRPLRPGR